MSKKEKIIETIVRILPDMSDVEQEKLLSFSEGMEFMKNKQKEKEMVHELAGNAADK
jgi:hypothetical protein